MWNSKNFNRYLNIFMSLSNIDKKRALHTFIFERSYADGTNVTSMLLCGWYQSNFCVWKEEQF